MSRDSLPSPESARAEPPLALAFTSRPWHSRSSRHDDSRDGTDTLSPSSYRPSTSSSISPPAHRLRLRLAASRRRAKLVDLAFA